MAPSFFFQGLSFSNNMCSYHQLNCNSDGKYNKEILTFIKNYAEAYFKSLIDLSKNNDIINHYCYSKENDFIDFWNRALTTGWAFEKLEMDDALFNNMKQQTRIHSLDLIKACYFFHQAYLNYKGNRFSCEINSWDFLLPNWKLRPVEIKDFNTNFFAYINEAIEYGSYHAGYLLLDIYLNFSGTENEELHFEKMEQQLHNLAEQHGSPGYLLLATLYLSAGQYKQCHDCLQNADALLTDSANEIHNSGNSKERITEIIAQLREKSHPSISEKNTESAKTTFGIKLI
jgi:Family of unknown function (DUF5630)